jgi:midasin (ATPase involved in ribosome maturation)
VESARLFEWIDGPLIEAMQKGDLFLADEISLADDSVLERLNSLLGMYECLCICMVALKTSEVGTTLVPFNVGF